MRARATVRGVTLLVLLLPLRSQADGPAGSGPPDSLGAGIRPLDAGAAEGAPWYDEDEIRAWLDALQDGGGLDPEDLPRPDPALTGGAPPVRGADWRGRLAARAGWRDGEARTRLLRLAMERGGWRVALRAWQMNDGERGTRGHLVWADGLAEGALGCLGWQHGQGLFCAAPGRWRSLSAGARLGGGGEGLAAFAGGEDPRALTAASLGLRLGGLEGRLLAGRLELGDRAAGAGIGLAALAVAGAWGRASLLAGRQGSTPGGSLAVRLDGRGRELSLEVAAWRPDGRGPAELAWTADLLRRGRGWSAEFLVAGSRAARPPLLADRPAVLPGPYGWGTALRLRGRLPGDLRGRLLLALGRGREGPDPVPELARRHTAELGLDGRPAPGWRAEVRWRYQREERSGWEGRAPWLPPAVFSLRRRQRWVARAWREADGWSLGASLRGLAETRPLGGEADEPDRSRHLISLQADRDCGARCRLRAGWGWAWGDDLDLLSVTAPAPGLILPRHWGAWTGESVLGAEIRFGAWRGQAAAALREPADPLAGKRQVEIWSRLEARW